MDAGAFLKYVLRPGALQEQNGTKHCDRVWRPFPDTTGRSKFRRKLGGHRSQRWDWGTSTSMCKPSSIGEQRADLFVSTIVEGPHTWKVRPVAEIAYEDDVGSAQSFSGLIGLIWQVKDNLAFDVAAREASINGRPVNELRAGLTFAFSLDRPMQSLKK